MAPITTRIGHYGNKFYRKGTRVYYEKNDHTEFFGLWLFLLLVYIGITIFILLNIQNLPHPNPSTDLYSAVGYLGLWWFIFIVIMLGISASYGEPEVPDTQYEKETKELLDGIKLGKRTEL